MAGLSPFNCDVNHTQSSGSGGKCSTNILLHLPGVILGTFISYKFDLHTVFTNKLGIFLYILQTRQLMIKELK